MIKQLLQKVFRRRASANTHTQLPAAQIIPAGKHKINQKHISQAALKTCDQLQKAGFQAYIVGGGRPRFAAESSAQRL